MISSLADPILFNAAAPLPTIGMIVPPAGDEVPPEAYGLYPDRVRFVARSLALKELSISGYDEAIEHVATLSRQLRAEGGAEAIMLMGTSLSFFRGGDFNAHLVQVMEDASGIRASTMSNAICNALRAVGSRRIAVGTAYAAEVNRKLCTFLEGSGFEVVHIEGLGLTSPAAVLDLDDKAVARLALDVERNSDSSADTILISCGGLKSLSLSSSVESIIGKPVVASATAGVWEAMRLLGLEATHPLLGRLGEHSTRPRQD